MNKLLLPSLLVNITLLGVFGIMLNNESIHEKECILPKENTNNHENGKCIVFTKCNFDLVNGSYILVSDEIMFLPTNHVCSDNSSCLLPTHHIIPPENK